MKELLKRSLPQRLVDTVRLFRTWRTLTSPRAARQAVGRVDSGWRTRIDDVMASPDNALISRCPEAGQLDGYHITMHNGVKVCANGYYGGAILNMLLENRGVHEPQEERAFEEVIQCLPDDPVMLELGAYWGFYSLSLLRRRPKACCYLIEPDPAALLSGRTNFRLNGQRGVFLRARVDQAPKARPRTISVDSFCQENRIGRLHVLHADIQGYELAMLQGATRMFGEGLVDYVFISTHTNDLHAQCLGRLEASGYAILAEVDMDRSFSVDGLIVARRQGLDRPGPIGISRKE